jgi:hypothetical protein
MKNFNQYQTTGINSWYPQPFAQALALDITNSPKQMVTLTDNVTSMTVSGTLPGAVFMVKFTQPAAGAKTITWFSGINCLTDNELNDAANTVTVYIFIRTGTGLFDGFRIGTTPDE